MKKAVWALLLLCLAGCVPRAIVSMGPGNEPGRIKRVALLDFEDYPGAAGSGKVAAGIFEKYLLSGGYQLADRRQVEAALQQGSIQVSGGFDAETIKRISGLLQVDALGFGQITDFTDPSQETSVVNMPLEQSTPIFGRETVVQKTKEGTVRTSQDVVTGYATTETDQPVQQTVTIPAHAGLSVRLVDGQTGQVLWSASASESGAYLNDALEEASAQIMLAVAKNLKRN